MGVIILIDEQATRTVARTYKFNVTGFAGVLLAAVEEGLLLPEQVRVRLELCRQQGTHYYNYYNVAKCPCRG